MFWIHLIYYLYINIGIKIDVKVYNEMLPFIFFFKLKYISEIR